VCSYDAGSCVTCEAGRYSDEVGSPCKSCPPGYGTSSSSSSEHHDSLSDCIACGPGQMSMNGVCMLCMPGFYSTGIANTACLSCPPGLITNGNTTSGYDSISKCRSCPDFTFYDNTTARNVRISNGSRVEYFFNEVWLPFFPYTSSAETMGRVICRSLKMGSLVSVGFAENSASMQMLPLLCPGKTSHTKISNHTNTTCSRR
jgi:hypothetical protein